MVARGCWLAAAVGLVLTLSLHSFAEASLSGSWSLSADIDSAAWPPTLSSSLDLTYAIGPWSFASATGLSSTGLSKLDFKAVGSFGDFSLSSSLSFDPAAVGFKRWSLSADCDVGDLSLSSSFELTPNYVALEVSADGSSGDVILGIDVELRSRGGCELLFDGIDISVGLPFCCADVSSEISFSCDGFEEAEFSVSDIEIPTLPWMTIDADLTFEMDEKALDLSPSFDFGTFSCIDLYIEVQTPSTLRISRISIYGIGISCDIGEVSFEALSYLDGTHLLKGTYWEMYSVSFNDEGCCGPFSGTVAVYFLEGGARLFDVAYLEGSLSIDLTESFAFDMGMSFDTEAGILEELTCGFEVSW